MPDEFLYHYCSLDAFLKIIESKEIWLTDIFSMNDAAEHYWLRKVAKDVLSKIERKDEFAELLDGFLSPKEEKTELYCCCLSEEWDSLGQWRAYAADGRGVAIGFDAGYFKQIEKKGCHFELAKVLYDRDEQEKLVTSIVEENGPDFREIKSRLGNSLRRDVAEVIGKSELWQKAARCKNPWFREEREVRLIYDPLPRPPASEYQHRFRVRNGKLIPYYALPLSMVDGAGPICEVVFGPKNEREHNERVARMLLAENGYNVDKIEFRPSEGTYT